MTAAPLAARIAAVAGAPVVALDPVAGGDICRAYRAGLADGRAVLAKAAPAPDMPGTEAAGLRWLAAGGARVPDVLGLDGDLLVLAWLPQVPPTPAAARRFGRELALLHASGAPAFGSPPPGAPPAGRIGSAPMTYAALDDWPSFFAEHRVRPYLDLARRRGRISGADHDAVAALCDGLPAVAGPQPDPARLHGDLWSGNVLWCSDGAALIDPAAHGGHPESDLAMLALFPPPHLADILAGYQQEHPLAEGWQRRVPLHQVYPLLVHAALFGGGYGAAAATAARRALGG